MATVASNTHYGSLRVDDSGNGCHRCFVTFSAVTFMLHIPDVIESMAAVTTLEV